MEYRAAIDPAYPKQRIIVASLEPEEYIDDIFVEEPDRWPMFASFIERIALRIRIWRINRRLGR